jgi:Sec7-like guanine-nucleotide exchange factor
MYSFFETAFAEYENKINKMISALEDEANYLQQLIEKLNKISDEWQTIEDSLLHFRKYGAGNPCIYPPEQNEAIEKELEELILCIVNEVNNNHPGTVSLN